MSQVVYITRKKSYSHVPDQESTKKIGSTMSPNGNPNTGLTMEEIQKIMPGVIGIPASDPAFMREVYKFFNGLTLIIPEGDGPKDGLALEIGTKDGKPISADDYVRYKFAMVHPWLKNKTHFVLNDPQAQLKAKSNLTKVRRKAYGEYLKAAEDEEKSRMILNVLGVRVKGKSKEEISILLEEQVNADAELFLQVAGDKNLEVISFIKRCVSVDLLQKIGGSFFDGDINIGDTEEQAAIFLQDQNNSELYVRLKARLFEAEKAD